MSLALIALPALTGVGLLAARGGWMAGRSRLSRRARNFARPATPSQPEVAALLRRPGQGRLDVLAARLLPRPGALKARLEAAGLTVTLGRYGLVCLGVFAAATVALRLLKAPLMISLMGGLAAGLWLPHLTVGFLMARRRSRFSKVFAEAIGLMVRGLRAGLPVSETIVAAGREIADPVGEEFRRVADQVRLGRPLDEALWQSAKRVDLPEFNFLVISLSVQRETGGNLAETLENLEQILRRRQQMRLKIKAMSSEATASALIVGSLPFVMGGLMSFVNGAYVHILFVEPLGRLMLAGGTASLLIGSFIMRQMVRFEI